MPLMPTRILLVDDEPSLRVLWPIILERAGYQVDTAAGIPEARTRMAANAYDIVITDLRLQAGSGLDVMHMAKQEFDRSIEVIVITGHGSVESAVEAMKQGAFDYLTKPVNESELLLSLRKALEHQGLLREVEQLRARGPLGEDIVQASPAMQEIVSLARRVAPARATVLLTGESGTGKERIARLIHRLSPRHDKPFVPINCGALPEGLLDSELFGHMKGSFTGAVAHKRGLFEEADGGTLFLDEVGEMPLVLQVKLLRVLQEGEVRRVGETRAVPVDVRVICATNRDIDAMAKEGTFRDDLLYRLKVFPINIPPLRMRVEDLAPLCEHILGEAAARLGTPPRTLSPDALELLRRYPWPGNIRELENALQRALLLATGPAITPEDLPPELATTRPIASDVPLGLTLAEVERTYVLRTWEACNHNQAESARRLGIARNTVWRMLAKYGVIAGDKGEE